jgi:hypothetical protein
MAKLPITESMFLVRFFGAEINMPKKRMDNYDLKEVINVFISGMSRNAASQKLRSTEINLAVSLKR